MMNVTNEQSDTISAGKGLTLGLSAEPQQEREKKENDTSNCSNDEQHRKGRAERTGNIYWKGKDNT